MRIAPLRAAAALAAAILCAFIAGIPSLLRESSLPLAEATQGAGPRDEPGSGAGLAGQIAVSPPRTPAEVRELLRRSEAADSTSVPALRRALASEDPLLAGNAIRALCRLGALDAREAIALLEDPRPRIRQEAVLCLGSIGGPAAVEALARVLGHGGPDLRALAIRSLREIGGDRALAVIEDRLRDSHLTEAERAFATFPGSVSSVREAPFPEERSDGEGFAVEEPSVDVEERPAG